jgi:PAS domain-containing protein
LHAKQLVLELRERDQQASLAADAASLGMWARDAARGTLWASDKWRTMFGFTRDEPVSMDQLLQRIHPDDRSSFQERMAQASADSGEYHFEYRAAAWTAARAIASQGKVVSTPGTACTRAR